MGRIPTVTSQVSSRSGRTTQGVPTRRASPDAFGANIGRGLQSTGAGVDDLAQGVFVREDKKRKEEAANRVAQADFTRTELEMRNQVGPGAEGYQEQTLDAYDEWVDEQAEDIEDDETRTLFKQRMAAQRPNVSSRAAQWEITTAAEHSKAEANASLTALDNKIRLSPTDYDSYIEQGFAVIDARDNVPASMRAGMKEKWRENAALSRFEGILESATTVEDVKAIQAELADTETRDWTAELSSAGLERVTSLADSAAKSIQTKADADARAAIEFLEGRADDVTAVIPKEELAAAQQVVEKSSNPITQARMARIVRDQEIVTQTRRLTPAQQREQINTRYNNPSLPSALNTAINRAAQTFGVSPAYLAATAKREYGVFLKGDDTDYTQGNIGNNSTAVGPMQFIEETWLGVVKNPAFQAAAGISIEGKSNAELLAMRGDVDLALMGGAFFTAQNAKLARKALGREPTDADLYIMHFMGVGGGPRLFRMMKANPNVKAADMFPGPAKANKSVYYNKDGSPRTVLEVYNELGRMHATGDGSETYIEYGDRQTRERVLEDTETRLNDDPMDFARRAGTVAMGDVFEPGGMAARGEQARSVADYYDIPESEMKPFTNDEAARIAKQFQDGNADDVLSILTSIQQMGGATARAAMSQLGDVSDVYAYAGGLQLETGQGAVAAEVVRGQKRLDENPDIVNNVGVAPREVDDAFLNATGGALMDAAPSQRQAIKDAALAHYVETQVSRGRAGKFNQDAFTASVQAVLGARQGAPTVDTVNGEKTVIPPGLTGGDIENALDNMNVADWTTMSEQGLPPRYVTGEIADPEDLSDEARLRAIGGGRYRVMTSDGNYLITGEPAPNGQLEPYVFVPTAEAVRNVNSRDARRVQEIQEAPVDEDSPQDGMGREIIEATQSDGELTHLEYRALVKKYGAEAMDEWAADNQ